MRERIRRPASWIYAASLLTLVFLNGFAGQGFAGMVLRIAAVCGVIAALWMDEPCRHKATKPVLSILWIAAASQCLPAATLDERFLNLTCFLTAGGCLLLILYAALRWIAGRRMELLLTAGVSCIETASLLLFSWIAFLIWKNGTAGETLFAAGIFWLPFYLTGLGAVLCAVYFFLRRFQKKTFRMLLTAGTVCMSALALTMAVLVFFLLVIGVFIAI